jgi:hypothetical protein
MNIKKIIKEEIDDFEWTKDIEPSNFTVGDCILFYRVRWTITSIDDGYLTVRSNDFDLSQEWAEAKWLEETVTELLSDGTMKRCEDGDDNHLTQPE